MEQSKQKGDETMDVVDPVRPGMWPALIENTGVQGRAEYSESI